MGFKRGTGYRVATGVGVVLFSGCGMFGDNSLEDCELKGGLAARANAVIQENASSSNPYNRFEVLPDVLSIHNIGKTLEIIDGLPKEFASRKIQWYIKVQEFLDEHPKYLEEHQAVAKQLNSYESKNKLAKK